MNLFVTSTCPVESARALDDYLLAWQVSDVPRMLSSALAPHGVRHPRLPWADYAPDRAPVVAWLSRSRANWMWGFQHFEALCREKRRRDPEGREPFLWRMYGELLPELADAHMNAPLLLERFANHAVDERLGIDFRRELNVPRAYRLLLVQRWQRTNRPPRWTDTRPPLFFLRHLESQIA